MEPLTRNVSSQEFGITKPDGDMSSEVTLSLFQDSLSLEPYQQWELTVDHSIVAPNALCMSQEPLPAQAPLSSEVLASQTLDVPVMPGEAVESTTLCSTAFFLVMRNNRKGYTVADLDLRLRAGYRYGSTASEGCRVKNNVLFDVLAEIS